MPKAEDSIPIPQESAAQYISRRVVTSECFNHPTVWRVWCDASHGGKPKRSAWGAVILDPEGLGTEHAGILPDCDSNVDAELWAVLKSLQQVPDQASVVVMCDCSPVVNGLQALLVAISGTPADAQPKSRTIPKFISAQPAFLQQVQIENDRLQDILVRWIKGHNGDFGNIRADWLASSMLKPKQAPFVHCRPSKIEDIGFVSEAKPARPDQYWKSYVNPINQLLQRGLYATSKGDGRAVTKRLCDTGVLDASKPYHQKEKGRLPTTAQISIAAQFLRIQQGKNAVRQKISERKAANATRKAEINKERIRSLAAQKRNTDKALCDDLLRRMGQGEQIDWKTLTAAPHAFIHTLERKQIITKGEAANIIRARETALTAVEAAKFLHTTTPRIRRLDEDGRLPNAFERYGHKRWLRVDLQDALPLMSEWSLADNRTRAAAHRERVRANKPSAAVGDLI